jgi:hypothetical protein
MVSSSLSSVLVRKEGETEQSLKELDCTTTARPAAQTNTILFNYVSHQFEGNITPFEIRITYLA